MAELARPHSPFALRLALHIYSSTNLLHLGMMLLAAAYLILVEAMHGLPITLAQVLQNGQVFTNGLAIYDSPGPNSYVCTHIALGITS